MQLYILTSRTLTLRLHFYLGNVSGDSDSPSLEGDLLTLDPVLSICGPPSAPFEAKQFLQGLPGDMPTKIYPKHWKFREPLSSPKGYKLCDCFFPSTPVVLHLFLFCASSPQRVSRERFHQDE